MFVKTTSNSWTGLVVWSVAEHYLTKSFSSLEIPTTSNWVLALFLSLIIVDALYTLTGLDPTYAPSNHGYVHDTTIQRSRQWSSPQQGTVMGQYDVATLELCAFTLSDTRSLRDLVTRWPGATKPSTERVLAESSPQSGDA